jgi:spermidine/putrescine transport system permease protein
MTHRMHPWVSVLAIGTLAFLYLPMVAVGVFSVNAARYGFAWKGFTLQWYTRLFRNEYVLEAARNTLILAVVSTVIATLLGTLLALGMWRFPWSKWLRRYLDVTVYLPVVTPDIIFAAAVVVAFGFLRTVWAVFQPGLLTMIVAHVTFQTAFVAMVVQSRLTTIGVTLEEAARDLYADTPYLLRRVMLPLLMPGIVAGAMLAFMLSLDDFVISFFTAGPESTTLPIYIYASVRRGVTPEIHALSTLVFLVTVLLVIGLERLLSHAKE